MATVASSSDGRVIVSKVAGEDLSDKQYHLVKLDTDEAVLCDAAGEDAFGVLQNAPESGELAEVLVFGPTKVKCGGNITSGNPFKTAADGEAVAATAATTDTSDTGAASDALVGSHVLGEVYEAGADTRVVSAFFNKRGAIPTTAA